MTSELIDRLKSMATQEGAFDDKIKSRNAKTLLEAIDTIQLFRQKLNALHIDRSSQFYNSGWIPCEDRVPLNDDYVLAWNGNPIVAYYDGEWYSNDGNFDEAISPITYWMPLPKEPKEVE